MFRAKKLLDESKVPSSFVVVARRDQRVLSAFDVHSGEKFNVPNFNGTASTWLLFLCPVESASQINADEGEFEKLQNGAGKDGIYRLFADKAAILLDLRTGGKEQPLLTAGIVDENVLADLILINKAIKKSRKAPTRTKDSSVGELALTDLKPSSSLGKKTLNRAIELGDYLKLPQ